MDKHTKTIVEAMTTKYGTCVHYAPDLSGTHKSQKFGYDKIHSIVFKVIGGYPCNDIEKMVEDIIGFDGEYVVSVSIDCGFKTLDIDIHYKEVK